MGNRNFIAFLRQIKGQQACQTHFSKLFSVFVLVIVLLSSSQLLYGQASNSDYDKIKVGEANVLFSGLALSPNGQTVAFTEKQSSALKIFDWGEKKIINEFNAGSWSGGSRVSYSKGGKYLLLQQFNYWDLVENKTRKIDFEILDATSGKQVRLFEKVQDVVISQDEKWAVSLSNGEVTFWNLADSSRGRSFNVSGGANAIDLSPDGRIIAVSHMLTKADFAADSRDKKKKKAVKFAIKYKQMVSLYNAMSFDLIKNIWEPYDIIYNIKFSPDGRLVYVFQNPHLKAQTSKKPITYINLFDIDTKEPVQPGFTSQAISQPDLKFSNNGKMFAINSKGNRFQEIHLYDFESGTLLKRFELGYRMFEKSDGEKFINDSRPSFAFLPGDKSILISIGNHMFVWNLEFNQ